MTAAVCYRCGAMKTGALSACPECGAQPDRDDAVKSVALSDRFMTAEELRAASITLSRGDEAGIDPQLLARVSEALDERKMRPRAKVAIFVAMVLPLVLSIVIVIVVLRMLRH